MEHHTRRDGGHAALAGRFLDRKTLQLHVLDETSLPVGQTLQQAVEVGAQRAFLRIVRGEESAGVLEWDVSRPIPPAQVIDELVAGQGVCPGREWKRSVVGVTFQMHREQCLLDEILDFGGGGTDSAAKVATQVAAENHEELTVRAGIAFQAAEHQRPEALFGLVLLRHGWVDSLAERGRPHSNVRDPQTTN